MTTLLIGHRGSGKTAFLNSLKEFAGRSAITASFFDLDHEIESQTGKFIHELFAEGEPAFRAAEKKAFAALMDKKGDKYIALGAGFEGPLPADCHVLWIRRGTDAGGRVFLIRPRLNTELSPYAEYIHRFQVREHRFKAWAHEQLLLPEGYAGGLEDFVLKPHALYAPFDFTLLPEHFRDWNSFWQKRSTWGVRRFELRDDLLTPVQIARARESIPPEKILYSVRANPKIETLGAVDWAMELGAPKRQVDILSLHERDSSLQSILKDFGAGRTEILKLAVPIGNFTELKMCHDWWQKDPQKRAFLPRSKDGRWRWYRSLYGPRMPVHYYREDEGSAADQPFLWQTQLQPAFDTYFAAVLGDPVGHSRSPLEHAGFFKDRKMPFVAIKVGEDEFSGALDCLMQLGLTHAAVTAPLKKAAFEACNTLTSEAEEMNTVNTIFVSGPRIEGHNTDVLALKDLSKEYAEDTEVWLWGGGGVRSSVRAAFPLVKEFSARTGLPHPGIRDFNAPKVLIWAAGRSREFRWPPESVKTGQILDLNYGDDSPGLEWAVVQNLPYQSGLKMFKLQAEYQRRFWRGN